MKVKGGDHKKAFVMDPEAFLDLANQVAKIKMYPYFDLAHAVVCCLIIKEDMGSGKIKVFPGIHCPTFGLSSIGIISDLFKFIESIRMMPY